MSLFSGKVQPVLCKIKLATLCPLATHSSREPPSTSFAKNPLTEKESKQKQLMKFYHKLRY